MTLKNKTYLNSQLFLAGLPVILLCHASTFWKLGTLKETGSTGSTLRKMEGAGAELICQASKQRLSLSLSREM